MPAWNPLDILSMLNIFSAMPQDIKKLGSFLASARTKLGMTLRAVEKETGISNAYLSQLEHAKIRTPAPPNLFKLAELYRVPYELLMELAGYPLPKKARSTQESLVQDAFAARVGGVTKEEEEALIEYLQFIRSRKRGR